MIKVEKIFYLVFIEIQMYGPRQSSRTRGKMIWLNFHYITPNTLWKIELSIKNSLSSILISYKQMQMVYSILKPIEIRIVSRKRIKKRWVVYSPPRIKGFIIMKLKSRSMQIKFHWLTEHHQGMKINRYTIRVFCGKIFFG